MIMHLSLSLTLLKVDCINHENTLDAEECCCKLEKKESVMTMKKMYESTRVRSLLKSITFRISATALTMLLVFVFSREFSLTFKIGAADFISKIVLYYFHERAWNIIRWGK
ncbi:MAG: hypothetical protein B5M53_12645 [Candidatus Cloacimonas sp. 4484_209]|nr:MAG: hypothetical protein B5M53_12645 [Candidatus Cloacimonas sp. 4484_209]RLF95639.1 MAG: hypothetical protein DRN45_00635 [Thermococci archaeon]RLG00165.1 MAG: hypothetical protein DRN58_03900 [Thermococci archaeon]